MVAALLALFCELTSHPVFRECDVIDLSTEQMSGRVAIHDVTQHPVTIGDVLPPQLSLAGAWLLQEIPLAEKRQERTKQPSAMTMTMTLERAVATSVVYPGFDRSSHDRGPGSGASWLFVLDGGGCYRRRFGGPMCSVYLVR